MTATIARSGSEDIELTWQHTADTVHHYAIYRSETDFFAGGQPPIWAM